MKIVIDRNIPFIEGVFDGVCSVEYLPSAYIDHLSVKEADALIVRTRTRCDKALLLGTNIKMIATATAGYEHIDMDFCRKAGIEVFVARGCNASSVAQYIGSVLAVWTAKKRLDISTLTLGIVGYGFVGKAVEKMANRLGVKVLVNDPPLEQSGVRHDFVSLSDIAEQCDIISFHTSLTNDGNFPTYHLANTAFFERCAKRPLIVNAARGGIVDERAMAEAYRDGRIGGFAIDCWVGEPDINSHILKEAFIATPHIAGYSADGKANATAMCINAISEYFSLNGLAVQTKLSHKQTNMAKGSQLLRTLIQNYDIERDSINLKNNLDRFEYFRNNYPERRELELS